MDEWMYVAGLILAIWFHGEEHVKIKRIIRAALYAWMVFAILMVVQQSVQMCYWHSPIQFPWCTRYD